MPVPKTQGESKPGEGVLSEGKEGRGGRSIPEQGFSSERWAGPCRVGVGRHGLQFILAIEEAPWRVLSRSEELHLVFISLAAGRSMERLWRRACS